MWLVMLLIASLSTYSAFLSSVVYHSTRKMSSLLTSGSSPEGGAEQIDASARDYWPTTLW